VISELYLLNRCTGSKNLKLFVHFNLQSCFLKASTNRTENMLAGWNWANNGAVRSLI
jgi:hypothetical protein